MNITRKTRSDYIHAQNTEFSVKVEDGKAFISGDSTRSGGTMLIRVDQLPMLTSLLIELNLELAKGERL